MFTISSYFVSGFFLHRTPDSAHSCSSFSSPVEYKKANYLNHFLSPSPPGLCSSLQAKLPIDTPKTPSPVITYKHFLFRSDNTPQSPVEMEAQVLGSPMRVIPTPKPTTAFGAYSDSPVSEKLPDF